MSADQVDAERVREAAESLRELLYKKPRWGTYDKKELEEILAALTPTPAAPCMLADCEGADGEIPPHPYHPPEQPAAPSPGAPTCAHGLTGYPASADGHRVCYVCKTCLDCTKPAPSPDAATGGERVTCPKCGGTHTDAPECPGCGYVRATPAPSKSSAPAPEGAGDDEVLRVARRYAQPGVVRNLADDIRYIVRAALSAATAENARLTQELAQSRELLGRDLQDARDRIDALEIQHARLREERDAAERRYRELESPLYRERGDVADSPADALRMLVAERDALRAKLDRNVRAVQETATILDAAGHTQIAIMDGAASLVRERDTLRAKLSASETRCAGLQREHDLTARVATEQRQRADELAAKLAEAERLRAFDTGARELPKGVMLEYQRLDGMWRKLVKEKDEAKERADAAEAKLREYHAELGPLISPRQWAENFNAAEKERDAAESRAKEAERERDEFRAELFLAAEATQSGARGMVSLSEIVTSIREQRADAERRIGEAVKEERKRCADLLRDCSRHAGSEDECEVWTCAAETIEASPTLTPPGEKGAEG